MMCLTEFPRRNFHLDDDESYDGDILKLMRLKRWKRMLSFSFSVSLLRKMLLVTTGC